MRSSICGIMEERDGDWGAGEGMYLESGDEVCGFEKG